MNDDKAQVAHETEGHEREYVRACIRAHEASAVRVAARDPAKAAEHELAARLLREQYGIPLPYSFGREGRDHAAERAPQILINQWKETR